MINFFRSIRRKLAFDDKFARYMRYAIGEVLLIMLGIFMALQLQNWNENRKKEIQFKNTAEQLYNKINDDSWYYDFSVRELADKINTIDYLISHQQDPPLDTIPGLLWSFAFDHKAYESNALSILENLSYNLDNSAQVKLANQLSDYQELIDEKSNQWLKLSIDINKFLIDHNVPFPKFNYDQIDRGLITDSTYYTSKDLQNALSVLKNENFITRLKSFRSYLTYSYLDFKSLEEESLSMLSRIKAFHPEVKLLFEDVGIIGTSINGYNDVGAHSTPMFLSDEEKSIWEIEMYLKVGTVKFRCRDSWAINWGGDSFPNGTPAFNGPNIPVTEAGNYRIILNLTAYTYEFIKLND